MKIFTWLYFPLHLFFFSCESLLIKWEMLIEDKSESYDIITFLNRNLKANFLISWEVKKVWYWNFKLIEYCIRKVFLVEKMQKMCSKNYSPFQNILTKIKSSKVRPNWKTLISVFAFFLKASATKLFIQGRLDCPHAVLRFCEYFWISLDSKFSVILQLMRQLVHKVSCTKFQGPFLFLVNEKSTKTL